MALFSIRAFIKLSLVSSGSASGSGCNLKNIAGRRALWVSQMAGQGAYIPSVAIAGAPPEFIAPPAAIPTADAVGPQDVIAAARYKKAVKQLRGVWQALAEFC